MNVHSVSLKGKRDTNEDKHIININIDGSNTQQANVNVFGIFDGHGGKNVSKHVYNTISNFFINKNVIYPLTKKYVYDSYDSIQRDLRKCDFAYKSGCTALIVVNFKQGRDQYLNILNTGDCRCVMCRDNFAMPLTKDHKPHWPEEKSRIEQLGGNIIYDGFDWRIKELSVSRAFGDLDAVPFLTHRPELFKFKIDKTDKFFVMACDGLWDVVTNEEAINFVLANCYDNSTKTRINRNINIAKKLGEYALQKGSGDNITIIVVFL